MTATKTDYFSKNDFLTTVSTEQAGFKIGEPKRVDEKSLAVVVPILRPTDDPRIYRTFPEVPEVDVTDTGRIDEMLVENKSAENVFIRSGTLFVGKTQSRALQTSAILAPREKLSVAVRCVHASHGISGGSKVFYGGTTPHDMDKGNYTAGYTPADQYTFWSNVAKTSAQFSAFACGSGGTNMSASAGETPIGADMACDAPSPSLRELRARLSSQGFAGADNLKDNFDKFSKDFEGVLAKVERMDNQTGLALLNDNGVETIELYDHCESWKAFHDAAVKRLGTQLVRTDDKGVFEFKPEVAHELVRKTLQLPYRLNILSERLPHRDDPLFQIFGMTADNFVGEMALVDGKVIHLVILKRDS